MALSTRERADALAGGLPSFTVRALRVAANVIHGSHGRRRRGSGETFWQFRQYQPGDPLTTIDWRRTAASADVYVREQEWEVAQSVWLWCDRSPSMDYASSRNLETKHDQAILLTLTLAALLLRGGETVGLLGETPRPGQGRAMLERIANHLTRDLSGGNGTPPPSRVSRHAQVVLIGDFLDPVESLEARIRTMAHDEVEGHLVQVLDPAEEQLPFRGRIRFTGTEDEDSLLVGKVESIRHRYARRMSRHQAELRDLARSMGWHYLGHRTDRSPEVTLLGLHRAMVDRLDML